jgi:hypothetical protein
VSFVVGTYVLTDTITHVFDDIFRDVYSTIDVNVRHTSDLGSTLFVRRFRVVCCDVETVPEFVRRRATFSGSVSTSSTRTAPALAIREAPSFGRRGRRRGLTPFTLRDGRKPVADGDGGDRCTFVRRRANSRSEIRFLS